MSEPRSDPPSDDALQDLEILTIKKSRGQKFLTILDKSAPKALESTAAYTKEEIDKRVEWCKQRRSRKLSPVSANVALMYDMRLGRALNETLTEEERAEALDAVRLYDKKWQMFNSFTGVPDDDLAELLEQAEKLMRLQLLARYGDHCARILNKLKSVIEKKVPEYKQYFGSYWTTIWQNIKEEQKKEQALRNRGEYDTTKTPTLSATSIAAQHLACSTQTLLFAIEFYVERNEAFHQPLDEYFQKGDGPGFCKLIFEDLQHSKKLIQGLEDKEMMELHGVVKSFQATYIDTRDEEDNTGVWIVNDAFLDRHRAIRNSQQDPGLKLARSNLDEVKTQTVRGLRRNIALNYGYTATCSTRKRNLSATYEDSDKADEIIGDHIETYMKVKKAEDSIDQKLKRVTALEAQLEELSQGEASISEWEKTVSQIEKIKREITKKDNELEAELIKAQKRQMELCN